MRGSIHIQINNNKEICRKCGLPLQACVCEQIVKSSQKIQVTTDKKKYGKTVTIVSGFEKGIDVKKIAKDLKNRLACGGTYKDGIIEKSKLYFPHIDIIRFDKFMHPIEKRLYQMFVDHRMKTYLGSFHNNPGYQQSYGWAEMQRDLSEIETMANNLRK